MNDKRDFVEDYGHLNESEVRARLLDVKDALRVTAEQVRLRKLNPQHRATLLDKQRELIREKDALQARLHYLSQVLPRGSVKVGVRGVPIDEIPDDGFVDAMRVQRGIVDAFKMAYHREGEHFGSMLAEGIRRGLMNPDGTPVAQPVMPHGVIPTLEEAAKPLGYVSGYNVGAEPRFPQHDDRRIYAGKGRPPAPSSVPKDQSTARTGEEK